MDQVNLEEKDTRIFLDRDKTYEMIDGRLGEQMQVVNTLKKLKQEYKDIDKEGEELLERALTELYARKDTPDTRIKLEKVRVKMEQLEKIKKEEENLRDKCVRLVMKYKIYGWSQEYFRSIENLEPYLEDPLSEDMSNTKELSQNGVETSENDYMKKVEEVVVKENPLIRNVENLETIKIWETVEEVSINSPQLVKVQSKNVIEVKEEISLKGEKESVKVEKDSEKERELRVQEAPEDVSLVNEEVGEVVQKEQDEEEVKMSSNINSQREDEVEKLKKEGEGWKEKYLEEKQKVEKLTQEVDSLRGQIDYKKEKEVEIKIKLFNNREKNKKLESDMKNLKTKCESIKKELAQENGCWRRNYQRLEENLWRSKRELEKMTELEKTLRDRVTQNETEVVYLESTLGEERSERNEKEERKQLNSKIEMLKEKIRKSDALNWQNKHDSLRERFKRLEVKLEKEKNKNQIIKNAVINEDEGNKENNSYTLNTIMYRPIDRAVVDESKKEKTKKSKEYVNKNVQKMPEGRSMSIKEIDEEIQRSKRAYDYRYYV